RGGLDDGVLDDGALPYARTGADHRQRPDAHAGLDDRVRADDDRRDEPGARTHLRGRIDGRVVAPQRVADVGRHVALEDVAVRLEVRLGRADVEPVPGQGEPV